MQTIKKSSLLDTGKILKAICITWFITKIICYKLWAADRLFPLVPVNKILLSLPPILHSSLFMISLGCMVFILFFPGKKIAALLLITELLSCCLDQNRWQPWEYQFILMLSTFVFIKRDADIRFSWQLIIAGIFFFSGISKLNSSFIHDSWQNLILHRWLGIGDFGITVVRLGYALPLIELSAAICLLINRTRKAAVLVLIFMHIIILLMLGPLGLNINAVIWSWNLLMPLLLISLFYRSSFKFDQLFAAKPFTWLIVLCCWLLPWLQLAGYWDKYLSSVLYGGGVEQLFICTDDPKAKTEMSAYMDNEFKVIPCSPVLSVYKWGIAEMRTAPYPEKRVFNAIIESWKKRYPVSSNRFYMYKPGFKYKVEEIRYP